MNRLTLLSIAVLSCIFHGSTFAAPTVSPLNNATYTEGESAISLTQGMSVTDAEVFTDGKVLLQIASPNNSDQFRIISDANPTQLGAISISNNDVFLGDGVEQTRIGSLVQDGQHGAPLEVNFSTPLENGSFEEGLLPWVGYFERYGDDAALGDEINLDGFPITLDLTDPDYAASTDPNGAIARPQDPSGTMSHTIEVRPNTGVNNSSALRLQSSGGIVAGNNLHPDAAARKDGYGSYHGPYVQSAVFTVEDNDALTLEFKAIGNSDDYEVFGLIRRVDANGDFVSNATPSTSTSADNVLLFAQRGNDTAGFTNITKTGLRAGAYRFEFISGTYDFTGGLAVGSELFVDNVRLIPAKATQATNVEAILDRIEYFNTANDPVATPRTLTLSVTNGNQETTQVSSQLTLIGVNDAPQLHNPSVYFINEGEMAVSQLIAINFEHAEVVEFTLSGEDADAFDIGIHSGVLSFKQAPDFETPHDANGDNAFQIRVHATDDGDPNLSDQQNLNIRISDLDESDFDNDGQPNYLDTDDDNDGLSDVLEVGLGSDPFNSDSDGDGIDDATEHSDGTSLTSSDSDGDGFSDFDEKVAGTSPTDINTFPSLTIVSNGGEIGAANVQEGNAEITQVIATSSARITLFAITGGVDEHAFSINAFNGALRFNTAPDFELPADANNDGVYHVEITVTDAIGNQATQQLTVTVMDVLIEPLPSDAKIDAPTPNARVFNGQYLQLGITPWGNLGNSDAIALDPTSGVTTALPGMVFDPDGFSPTELGVTDGSAIEMIGANDGFAVGYTDTGANQFTQVNSSQLNAFALPTQLSHEQNGNDIHVVSKSLWSNTMSIKQSVYFEQSQRFVRHEVSLANISGSTWQGARFMRFITPVGTQNVNGTEPTRKHIEATQLGGDGIAVVTSTLLNNSHPLAQATESLLPLSLYSQDIRARVSSLPTTHIHPYQPLAYDAAREKDTLVENSDAMSITFETGVLNPGESAKFVYYLSVDTQNFSQTLADIQSTEQAGDALPTPVEPVINSNVTPFNGAPSDIAALDGGYDFRPVVNHPSNLGLTFSVTNLPSWAVFNPATGQISGSPGPSDLGVYPDIEITVTDANGNTDTLPPFNIVLVAENTPPHLTGTAATQVHQDALYQFMPTLSDANLPVDNHTFSVTNLPSWAQFNALTGEIRGTPDNDDVGQYPAIQIQVTDVTGNQVSFPAFDVQVINVNDAPTASNAQFSLDEDSDLTFALSANDIDGDAIRFEVVSPVNNGELQAVAANRFYYQPKSNFFGQDSFRFVVNDGQARSAIYAVSFQVYPINDEPFAQSASLDTQEDNSVSFRLFGEDVDNINLQYELESLPQFGQISGVAPNLTYTPNPHFFGSDSLSYHVFDGNIRSASETIDIQVVSVNDLPDAQNDHFTIEQNSIDNVLDVLHNDTDIEGDALQLVATSTSAGSLTILPDNTLSYTPAIDATGLVQIHYQIADAHQGLAEAVATVQITPKTVNLPPIAQEDSLSLTQTDTVLVDVLQNDTDPEGDTLRLLSVQANSGSAVIEDQYVAFTPDPNINGRVVLHYVIADSNDNTASAQVLIDIDTGIAPQVTVPPDLCGEHTVQATGLFTRVELGDASAQDRFGNPIPVSLVDGTTLFPPGVNQVQWVAEDDIGNITAQTQLVCVHPLVSFAKDQVIAEGHRASVQVFLNGESPTYPVAVSYRLSGSATPEDHDLVPGTLLIDSGTQGRIDFNIIDDGLSDADETLTLTLQHSVNTGDRSQHTLTLVEGNTPPRVTLSVTQQAQERLTVSQVDGEVTLQAFVEDSNVNDTHQFEWEADSFEAINTSPTPSVYRFEPSLLTPGLYRFTIVVTDDGTPSKQGFSQVLIEVVNTLPTLTDETDSDGDLVPDAQEGFADSDQDGIPDYLDRISECNVVPQQARIHDAYLLESQPGVCLRRGEFTVMGETGGVQITDSDLTQAQSQISADEDAINVGGIFDYIAYGLPNDGDQFSLVSPQRAPIPEQAVFRKFAPQKGWYFFVEDANNSLWSSPGEPGYCPPPSNNPQDDAQTLWTPGLTPGHWCVMTVIQDGGPNDDDAIANGTIVDPGFVGVLKNQQTVLPNAINDEAQTEINTPVSIDVLANDTHEGQEALRITSASASLGSVVIIDGLLHYTPPENYVGEVTIIYGVASENSGTAQGQVVVSIHAPPPVNHAPIANDDHSEIQQGDSITVNVLANDTDPEQDALQLADAFISDIADISDAAVTFSASGEVIYTPNPHFFGEHHIQYFVLDSAGNQTQGMWRITVLQTPEPPMPEPPMPEPPMPEPPMPEPPMPEPPMPEPPMPEPPMPEPPMPEPPMPEPPMPEPPMPEPPQAGSSGSGGSLGAWWWLLGLVVLRRR